MLRVSEDKTVGVQYGKAMGMRVIAIDGGEDKRKLCIDKLGAEKFIDFEQEKDIPKAVTEMTKVSTVTLVGHRRI